MKKKILHLLLQMCLCLGFFFAMAVFIFLLRNKDDHSFSMPNFVNKNFLDIYDEIQRLELRVKLSRREYGDIPAGFILAQSPLPGQKAQARDKLHLTINQALPFLTMPDLRSRSLAYARSSIERIPAGDNVYALKIASVSKIYTDKFPHNSIISQFPMPGDLVGEEENVYLLLALRDAARSPKDLKGKGQRAEDKSNKKQSKENTKALSKASTESWIGQNFTIAAHYFHHQRIDYRIRRFLPSRSKEQNGKIQRIDTGSQGALLLDVYFNQNSARRGHSAYERVQIELDEKGPCLIEGVILDQKKGVEGERLHVFSTRKHRENEEIDILFYRQGAMRLEARCGGELVYKKNFYPKSIS